MTQVELLNLLKATGFPVAYSHFVKETPPPYLIYVFSYSGDLMADNTNYQEINNFQVELYTTIKDLGAERKIQDALKGANLPYRKTESWIDSEKLFQIIYEIQLIGA